jgi:hypothetical protein
LVKSYTLLWKLHKCTGGGRRLLFLTSLLTVETLNVYGFWSWSFIIHCVSLIHLSCTLLLLTLCFDVRRICETRVGEAIFPCPLSTIVVFAHLFVCYYSYHPLVYTKSPNFVSIFHPFYLCLKVCYASGERPWRDYLDNSTIYFLNSKP